MEFIQLLGQESPTPCAAVNPIDDFLYGKNNLLFGFNGKQWSADLGMSPPPSSNGNKKMPVLCFKEIKMAGLDAYPALDALIFCEYWYAIPDLNGFLFAIFDAGSTSSTEAGCPEGTNSSNDANLIEHGACTGIRAARQGDAHLYGHILSEQFFV
jgi:hypothetical protein